MQNKFKHIHQRGAMLVELMVASALGVIVIGSAMQIFVNTKRVDVVVSDRMETQRLVREVVSLMANDGSMAGTYGCFNAAAFATNVGGAEVHGQQLIVRTNADTNNPMTVINKSGDAVYPYLMKYGVDILTKSRTVGSDNRVAALNKTVFSGGGGTSYITSITGDVVMFRYGVPVGQFVRKDSTDTELVFSLTTEEMLMPSSLFDWGVSTCGRLDMPSITMSGSYSRDLTNNTVTLKNLVTASGVKTDLYDKITDIKPEEGYLTQEVQLIRPRYAMYFVGTTSLGTGLHMYMDASAVRSSEGAKGRLVLISKNITGLSAKFGYFDDCDVDTLVSANPKIRFSKEAITDKQPAFISLDLTATGNVKGLAEDSTGDMTSEAMNITADGTGAVRTSKYNDIIIGIRSGAVCANRKTVS